jgi:hypothetical protein
VRISVPLLVLAAFAAAPLSAQKPGAADPERDAYRERGIALCVADLQAAEGATPDEVEAICGCAFERFMPRWPSGALPALGPGRLQPVMGGDVIACAAEQRPALAAAVARRLAATPPAGAPPLATEAGGKPTEAADAAAPGADRKGWFDGLSMPRWLGDSDLPLWAWVLLGLFVFLFLRGLLRRREERDLDGPPPSMRPGGRPGPPPPRR